MATPELRSVALRRIVLGFSLASAAALAAGFALGAATGDWVWPQRAGSVVIVLGVVLTSRKILIARNDLVALLHEMEAADGAERTARLAGFKRLQRDLDRQVFEKAGFALVVIGTLFNGFGDLIGRALF
jgi:hypothetical protein